MRGTITDNNVRLLATFRQTLRAVSTLPHLPIQRRFTGTKQKYCSVVYSKQTRQTVAKKFSPSIALLTSVPFLFFNPFLVWIYFDWDSQM